MYCGCKGWKDERVNKRASQHRKISDARRDVDAEAQLQELLDSPTTGDCECD
jgi:hypothetical protein